MRCALALLVVLAAADARADSRTQSLAKDYEKEQTACRKREDGLVAVLARAKELEEPALDDDVAALEQAHLTVASYCAELAASIEMLRADPSATYKSMQKQIDEHDSKIRALRKASTQAIDESGPILQRIVPEINSMRAERAIKPLPKAEPKVEPKPEPKVEPKPEPKIEPKPEPKPETAKGPGTWRMSVDYSVGSATLSLTVKAISDSCDREDKISEDRKKLSTDLDARSIAPGGLGLLSGARKLYLYRSNNRVIAEQCVTSKAGGYLVTADEPQGTHVDRDLNALAKQLLATAIGP